MRYKGFVLAILSEFVSCLAFVSIPDCHEALLVSGSGDSTVRLWDVTDGTLLDTCEVGTEVLAVDLI